MIKEEKLKEVTAKYNAMSYRIDWVTNRELLNLLHSNNVPYGPILIKILTDRGYLLKENKTKKYKAIKEPIHYIQFKKIWDKISEYNIVENTNTTTQFDALKKLIRKGVSDDVIRTLFPNINK